MADYNLNALSPRDFQHLVQAIARKRIATGVTSFGDGKDGNRDLMYQGKMDYPSTEGAWDGYLVLGCKFYQRPSGDIGKDNGWAIKHLKADLDKFLELKRQLPTPQYYIFVTNVGLTGVAERGGRDRINSVFNQYASKLALRGYGCWDYNDLRGFLDGDEDIRKTYGHFITVGDVLAQMMDLLTPRRPDFGDVMSTFLQKELLADMAAKLQSAGDDPEVQIPLAKVFVDLPVADSEAAAYAPDTEAGDPARRHLFVNLVLREGERVLRRTQVERRPHSEAGDRSCMSRFVLVGGPGQGKSTLGQYLCQLYRGAILNDRPSHCVDEKVPSAIRQLDKQREEVGGLPVVRRFPIRIELRTLAQAIANDADLTLIEYVRRQIARLGNATVDLEDLKRWLSIYPWVVVLDGLDEVPPSSNRDEVVRMIEHFRVDAASCNADMLMVATTRPQAYGSEFPADLFQHLYLMPLSPTNALDYGRLLAIARCGGDEGRRDDLIASLEKACENSTTARLMQSPLQVTIMATLLEETGDPPQQRYRLFAEYYRTIYKRETRRKLLGGVLTERQTDIDTIHNVAGLLLHARSEVVSRGDAEVEPGDADVALSDDQFRELVRRRLEQIRVPAQQAADFLKRITDGTLQRLVFLVRPKEGWIRFDIPSLKEFMAAEALMNGPDENVRERLKVIAPAAYWRNVLLFAIGKCFVEKEYLLDNVVSVCDALNDETEAKAILGKDIAGSAAHATRLGSRIALDILSDGSARQNPGYEQRLARKALELLRTGSPDAATRLATVYHEDLEQSFRESIADRLGQVELVRQRGAWFLVMSLADRGVGWAIETIDERWPRDRRRQWELLESRGEAELRPWFVKKLVENWPYNELWDVPRAVRRREWLGVRSPEVPAWWKAATDLFEGRPAHGAVEVRAGSQAYSFSVVAVESRGGRWVAGMRGVPKDHHSSWRPLVAAARFCEKPSHETLAKQLRWLSDTELLSTPRYWCESLPWPFAACLRAARSREELKEFARRAAIGALGSLETWRRAEKRWSQRGLTEDDFESMTKERWPFDGECEVRGFPFVAAGVSYSVGRHRAGRILWDSFKRVNSQPVKAWIARKILEESLRYRWYYDKLESIEFSVEELAEIVRASGPVGRPLLHLEWLAGLQPEPHEDSAWIELLEQVGREDELLWGPFYESPATERICSVFNADPTRFRGLLHILAALAFAGNRCVVSDETLERCGAWGDKARRSALLLRITRGDWSSNGVEDLARNLLREDEDSNIVWHALHVARRHVGIEQSAMLAAGLLKVMGASTEFESRRVDAVLTVLTDYLNKRPSSLDDPTTWQRVKLPERV